MTSRMFLDQTTEKASSSHGAVMAADTVPELKLVPGGKSTSLAKREC